MQEKPQLDFGQPSSSLPIGSSDDEDISLPSYDPYDSPQPVRTLPQKPPEQVLGLPSQTKASVLDTFTPIQPDEPNMATETQTSTRVKDNPDTTFGDPPVTTHPKPSSQDQEPPPTPRKGKRRAMEPAEGIPDPQQATSKNPFNIPSGAGGYTPFLAPTTGREDNYIYIVE
ncbi:hypothetical protein FS837_007352 [Tulasnella sp. UAMH 9824]|nr:hypothetical protein FS837_007352 [Tulasnella sp. UAMH 9824]